MAIKFLPLADVLRGVEAPVFAPSTERIGTTPPHESRAGPMLTTQCPHCHESVRFIYAKGKENAPCTRCGQFFNFLTGEAHQAPAPREGTPQAQAADWRTAPPPPRVADWREAAPPPRVEVHPAGQAEEAGHYAEEPAIAGGYEYPDHSAGHDAGAGWVPVWIAVLLTWGTIVGTSVYWEHALQEEDRQERALRVLSVMRRGDLLQMQIAAVPTRTNSYAVAVVEGAIAATICTMLMLWVALDAKARGLSAWGYLPALVPLTGLLFVGGYLLFRPPGGLVECPSCKGWRRAGVACTHCGAA
jgi:hypothetical protein